MEQVELLMASICCGFEVCKDCCSSALLVNSFQQTMSLCYEQHATFTLRRQKLQQHLNACAGQKFSMLDGGSRCQE